MLPWSLRSLTIALVVAFSASASPVVAATTITATPDSVSGSAPVAATAGLPAAGATAGTSQVITQSFNPTYLQVGSQAQVTAPEGWSLTYSSDGSTFGAAPATTGEWAAVRAVRASGSVGGTAATGGSVATSIPAPPSGTFSAAGGGDGWNVFFDDRNHVYNIWHHNGDTGYAAGNAGGLGAIDCHTRTGASCGPRWPFYMSATGTNTGGAASRVLNTGVRSPGWVDTANGHLWFPTNDNGTSTTAQVGFACLDVSDLATGPSWCGGSWSSAFVVLGSVTRGSTGYVCSTGSPPAPPGPWGCVDGLAAAGDRLYTVETRTGRILCLDASAGSGAGAPCAGQPYSLPGLNAAPALWDFNTTFAGSWQPALFNLNGNIFGTGLGAFTSTANPVLFCVNGTTGAACPGWTTPKALPADSWFTYAEPTSSGDIAGVCTRPITTTSAGSPTCFDAAGSSYTGNTAIANDFRQTAISENASGSGITVGTRVFWGTGSYDGSAGVQSLFCSDAATSAACAGWPKTSYDNYVIVVDPENDGCLWVNSHSGAITQLQLNGTAGCAGVPPTSATFAASRLVATERVSCTNSPAWGSLALTSPGQGSYATATLTVLTASNAVVVSGGVTWQNIPVVNGTVDLSGLAQADTGANPQFVINFTGRTNTDPIATTITSPAHAPQLCITLTPQEVACPYPGAPGGSLFPWTTPVTASGTQGSTSLSASEATVSFSGAGTAACTPPTPDVDPAPSKLAVRILPSRRTLKSGQTMRIGLRTRNPGPSPSVDTRSCIVLPSNFIIVRANGALRTGRTVCFMLGDMAVGAQKTRTIVVRAVSARKVTRRLTGVARSASAYNGQVARAISRAPVTTITPRAPRARVTG